MKPGVINRRVVSRSVMSRNALTLAAAIFIVGYGTNVSTPFLILYKRRLDLGASATMSIFVVYVIGILGTLMIIGPVSDRYGRRPVVLPFTLLSGVASLLLIPGRDSLALLLFGRFLLGAVSGAVLAIGAAWMLELMGREQAMRAAVVATTVSYLGFGSGPVLSAAFEWFNASPLVSPFIVHMALVVAIVALLLRVPETHPPQQPRQPLRLNFGVPNEARRTFLRLIVPPALWVFSFPSAGFALFPVLLSDSISGAEVTLAAASGAITAISGVSARPVLTMLGPRATLRIAMAVGTIGYVFGTLAFATGGWVLVLPAAFCLGAASGMITSAALTLIGQIADDESRGSISGTFYLLAYPGMAMPLIITGLAALIGSTSAALAVVTVAAACAAVLTMLLSSSDPSRT